MKNFLGVFTGSHTSAASKSWAALDAATKKEREIAGITAWKEWMETHHKSLVFPGGPLGKTKLVNPDGVSDIRNQMSAFVVARAESHEAASEMFLGHPHFTIFPGDGVEIVEMLPAPGH